MTTVKVKSLNQELYGVEEGQIVLLETSAERALEIGLSAMKTMTQKNKATVIILSASRPCTNLLMLYTQNNIKTDRLLILDCVCKTTPASHTELSNIIFLKDVSALTSISLAITESIKKIPGKKIVIIDSINSMIIHNQANTFSQFIHSLLTKMRLLGVGGILLSLEVETDRTVRAKIAQLCDKVVKA